MIDISNFILPLFVLFIVLFGVIKKVRVYETFIEGAKDGFKFGINILPYLIGIIVVVEMLRASGFIDIMGDFLSPFFKIFSIPTDIFPIMIIRSLSGAALLGFLSDIISNNGVESYATKMAAVMVGSSETTFYVLSVYFGAVGILKFRHALLAGILADFVGIVASIWICKLFFL